MKQFFLHIYYCSYFYSILFQFRVVRNDLSRYNEGLSDAEKEDKLDNGWKVVHGDVFRFPKWANLFCAVLGKISFATANTIILWNLFLMKVLDINF